jgi:hypothetical protein
MAGRFDGNLGDQRCHGLAGCDRGAAAPRPRSGSLKVVTTHLRPGYLRKNGVPYSANAVQTEYYDVTHESNGDTLMFVSTIVEDPQYPDPDAVMAISTAADAAGSPERRERRLAQADASIIRRNGTICPDTDVSVGSERLYVVQQQIVLKNASGKDDRIQPELLAQDRYCVTHALREPALKGPRAHCRISAPPPNLR